MILCNNTIWSLETDFSVRGPTWGSYLPPWGARLAPTHMRTIAPTLLECVSVSLIRRGVNSCSLCWYEYTYCNGVFSLCLPCRLSLCSGVSAILVPRVFHSYSFIPRTLRTVSSGVQLWWDEGNGLCCVGFVVERKLCVCLNRKEIFAWNIMTRNV